MHSDDPEDQYPLYPRGMLRRAGLLEAESLSARLPDWTEEDLQRAFWPAFGSIHRTEADVDIERHLGIDGGERVVRVNGQPIFVSEDRWMFEVVAGPELLDQLVAAMQPLRAQASQG
ncbi:hypothetical protein [Pseudomonas sp. CGJS7]|uniref:hypothetical protein n=1 Tax=Pseudomonas sp. CGJS7 TaxID=3109348 RepID=UPI0030098E4D